MLVWVQDNGERAIRIANLFLSGVIGHIQDAVVAVAIFFCVFHIFLVGIYMRSLRTRLLVTRSCMTIATAANAKQRHLTFSNCLRVRR